MDHVDIPLQHNLHSGKRSSQFFSMNKFVYSIILHHDYFYENKNTTALSATQTDWHLKYKLPYLPCHAMPPPHVLVNHNFCVLFFVGITNLFVSPIQTSRFIFRQWKFNNKYIFLLAGSGQIIDLVCETNLLSEITCTDWHFMRELQLRTFKNNILFKIMPKCETYMSNYISYNQMTHYREHLISNNK